MDAEEEGEPDTGDTPPRSEFGAGPRGGMRQKKRKNQNEQKNANRKRERRALALPSPVAPLALPPPIRRLIQCLRRGRCRFARWRRPVGRQGGRNRSAGRLRSLAHPGLQHAVQVLENGARLHPEGVLAVRTGDPELQWVVGHMS